MPKGIGVVWILTTVRRWVTYSQGCLAFFLARPDEPFEFLGAVTCSLEDQLSDRVSQSSCSTPNAVRSDGSPPKTGLLDANAIGHAAAALRRTTPFESADGHTQRDA